MEPNQRSSLPEVWAGIECTINRVGDRYTDQLDFSGHYVRPGDLQAFANLGIKKLRYPILWEKHQPSPDTAIDWGWMHCQLATLRDLNIIPVAGLLHHGSGPVFTDLLDPLFPEKFSQYAKQVAAKFPWLLYYTPVNEPLTTARFSGLYGLWYPHKSDDLSFFKMLLNQLKGVVMSMAAIRCVNPFAKLVQTEDLAKTHATTLLSYQADFENNRRWLTWDILCGKVDADHFFWNIFLQAGIPARDLYFFLDNPCPPDIIGCNYYVTSERWLRENPAKNVYGPGSGNGHHCYDDIAAAQAGCMDGLGNLLKEAGERYRIPLAITECHINCSREEQMRWLKESWETCVDLRRSGVPLTALTVWALMGALDWNSLLTEEKNHYETGVFDVTLGNLRSTALTKLIRSLAHADNYDHPVLNAKGWWNREITDEYSSMVPLILRGKEGPLMTAFRAACTTRAIAVAGDAGYLGNSRESAWADILVINEEQVKCSGNLNIVAGGSDLNHVAASTLDLLIDGESGTWHFMPGRPVKKMSQAAIMV